MFAEVNSLVFLLIFLINMVLCILICSKYGVSCCSRSSGFDTAKKLFLCGLAAIILTVLAIDLWYIALLLLAVAAKYLLDRCVSKGVKCVIAVGMAIWMVLIAAAGIQLMCNENAEEDDSDEAAVEDVAEEGNAYMTVGEIERGEKYNGKQPFGTGSWIYQRERLDI